LGSVTFLGGNMQDKKLFSGVPGIDYNPFEFASLPRFKHGIKCLDVNRHGERNTQLSIRFHNTRCAKPLNTLNDRIPESALLGMKKHQFVQFLAVGSARENVKLRAMKWGPILSTSHCP
jgi:hypothetical protein